ncbi:MAG: hypothetical protein L6437_14580, partial [Kiritimatiellae bacterium]|nr:hypothetical protein [Kiritimatiellia bacterium]
MKQERLVNMLRVIMLFLLLAPLPLLAGEKMMLLNNFSSENGAGLVCNGCLRIGNCVYIEKNGMVVADAEYGNKLEFELSRNGFLISEEASGKVALAHVNYLEIPFEVNKSGEYWVWYRAYFPFKGNWCHNEQMDDGNVILNTDGAAETEVNRWLWKKGPVYNLKKGRHIWKLHGWKGGTMLDKVIFSSNSAFVPAGLGIDQTGELPEKTASFISKGLPSTDGTIYRLAWEESSEGNVKAFISNNQGGKWREVGNNADFTEPVLASKMRVKFILTVSESGYSPIADKIKVYIREDESSFKLLENDFLRIKISKTGLNEVFDKQSQTIKYFCNNDSVFFKFRIKNKTSGVAKIVCNVDSEKSSLKNDDATIAGEFVFDGGRLIAKPSVRLDQRQTRWNMEIINNSETEILEVEYPIIKSIKCGEIADDDLLVMPACHQQVFSNPSSNGVYSSRINILAMRWLTLFDADSGFYFADHSVNFNDFNDTAIGILPSEDKSSLSLSFVKSMLIKPGAGRKVGEFVLGLYEGKSWHPGADCYREEVIKKMKKPCYPPWALWMDGWSGCPANDFPYKGFRVLQQGLQKAKETGGPLFIPCNRQSVGCSAWGGALFAALSPAWGTVEEFKQYVKDIDDNGGYANFYIAWNIIVPQLAYPGKRIAGYAPLKMMDKNIVLKNEKWFEQNRVTGLGRDDPFKKQYYKHITMCIGSTEWQDYMIYWSEKYVRDYGASGLYFDVLNCGQAYNQAVTRCTNHVMHGHSDLGIYLRDTLKTLNRITEKARGINPDFLCTGEFVNDIISQSGVVPMVSALMNHTELVRYAMPDVILLDGRWNSGVRPATGGEKRWNHIFLTGTRFEGTPPGHLLKLRHATRQFIYPALFRDNRGLILVDENGREIENPKLQSIAPCDGAQAKLFVLNEGYDDLCAVNVLNTDRKQSIKAFLNMGKEFNPGIKKAWFFGTNDTFRLWDVHENQNGYDFLLPEDEVACIVLVKKAFPRVMMEDHFVGCAGEDMVIKVRLLNLEDSDGGGSIRLKLPEGCESQRVVIDRLIPGEEKEFEIPVRIKKKAAMERKGRFEVVLNWRGKEKSITKTIFVPDFPVYCFLEEDSNKNLEVHLENLSQKKQSCRYHLEVPLPLTADKVQDEVELGAGEKRIVLVPLSGWNEVCIPLHIRSTFQSERRGTTKSIMLYPYVPNGDFECDSAGDLYPDWWMCWGLKDNQDAIPDFIKLDEKRNNGGKYSLRIDPHPTTNHYVRAM